jgi:CHAT domain-containing protein
VKFPMVSQTYLDFDLQCQATGRTYQARVLASPAGEASSNFLLPPAELDAAQLHPPGTSHATFQAWGERLFSTIFAGSVLNRFRVSQDLALQRSVGLRIRLRLGASPALAALPWEYLYDPRSANFLALSETTSIVRYLDLPQRIAPLTVQPPLKVLVMIANPHDQAQPDVEAEWHKVQDALADPVQRGLVTVTRLEQATLPALLQTLQDQEYHLLHFSGHARFEERTQEGLLSLLDETGATVEVSGRQLRVLADVLASVRLIVLNAGETGRASPANLAGGVAHSLVRLGVPAVLAMQFAIQDGFAFTFAQTFYPALASNAPLELALTRARQAIYAQGDPVGWGAPVLWLRAPDGHLFAPERTATAEVMRPENHSFWQKLRFWTRRQPTIDA